MKFCKHSGDRNGRELGECESREAHLGDGGRGGPESGNGLSADGNL